MHRWFGTSAQKAWVHPSLKVSESKRANVLVVFCTSHCEDEKSHKKSRAWTVFCLFVQPEQLLRQTSPHRGNNWPTQMNPLRLKLSKKWNLSSFQAGHGWLRFKEPALYVYLPMSCFNHMALITSSQSPCNKKAHRKYRTRLILMAKQVHPVTPLIYLVWQPTSRGPPPPFPHWQGFVW